jgi:hypothetical protein
MKRKSLFILMVVFGMAASAQETADTQEQISVEKMVLNFAVPDMPAFKSLGTEPSDILRPSTLKAIAATFSPFYQNRKIVLPEAFAVEIAPWLLLNSNKRGLRQLNEYADNKIRNSLRFSVGSSADSILSPSGRSLAFGARISLISEGDLLTDKGAQQMLSSALQTFRKNVRSRSLVTFAILHNIDTSQLDWEDTIMVTPALKGQFDTYLADENEDSQREFLMEINRIKKKYKEDHWNDNKLDLAVALVSSSPDSLVKNIRFNRAQLWLTGAFKAGNHGQFLIGVQAMTSRNLVDTAAAADKNYAELSIPARYLMGTNRVKGFAEGQYSYTGLLKSHHVFLNLGAELNIIDGVWLNVDAGLDYNTTLESSAFVTNLNLKLTLPENFSLF